MSLRTRITLAAGVLIALLATYFAVKDVDGQQLLLALSSAQYGYVIPALLVAFTGYFARAWRWQLMVDPLKHVPFKRIFPIMIIGFAWNVIIPLRIGEVVRAHLLGVRENISRPALLATVVVERVLDGVAVMALLSLVGWLTPALPAWAVDFTRIALVLFGIALIGLIMLIVSERFTLRLLALFTRLLPQPVASRVNSLAASFVQGYVALRSPGHLPLIVLSTILAWFVEIVTYAVLFPAFGLNLAPSIFVSATSFYAVVLNLATLVPSPPGFTGTIEGFGVAALDVFNINKASGLSLTVVGHAIQLVVILTLGAWAIRHEGLTLFDLSREYKENSSATT